MQAQRDQPEVVGRKKKVCTVYVCIVCSGNLVMQCDSSGTESRRTVRWCCRHHYNRCSRLIPLHYHHHPTNPHAGLLLSFRVLWHHEDTRLGKSYQSLPRTRAHSHMHTHWLALRQVPVQRDCARQVRGDTTILGDSFYVRFFKCWCVTSVVFDTGLWPAFISADN